MSRRYSLPGSFKFAFAGIKEALKNEPNFRLHSVITILVIIAGFIFHLNLTEFAIIALTIGYVLLFELINTSLEALVDLVSPEVKPKAKVAKDVAASAVLVSTVTAVAVGLLIFLPKIF